ncbi:cysteine-rich RLK (receptor-like kinase) protein, putative [Medicago truncatula]|uniref:Cysteine-rich RLK (Receptor-like kinase) protein, putative n=1 Tax=Medicago truncatula TaxID=3880 RepID=G8A075_MEDTR|nr:cysteine-rich RLK (receptor-like kinase) protein, putative [Medicago truncatula]
MIISIRRSLTACCIFLCSPLISWKSKRQNKVSHLSSEAEDRVLAFTRSELQ